jgi:hypothetical protein
MRVRAVESAAYPSGLFASPKKFNTQFLYRDFDSFSILSYCRAPVNLFFIVSCFIFRIAIDISASVVLKYIINIQLREQSQENEFFQTEFMFQRS